jgi:phosphoribosyl 1,2-cyclic phosphodiesterase
VRVYVLGNGSSGNCLVAEAEGERILVDAGMSPTRAVEAMRTLGADFITGRPPLGVFVTHEHGDHAAHATPVARALRAPLYAHDGAPLLLARRRVQVTPYTPGRSLAVGPFVVETLIVPHDATQVAVRVRAGGARFAIATDLGHPTKALQAFLAGCDLVFLEANHCPGLLAVGPYPPRLRERVTGPLGHLTNEQAGAVAASLEDTRVARLVLVHLSRTNNTPERAHGVVSSRVRRLAVETLEHGEARRFEVRAGSSMAGAEQLGLFPLG